jgi:hypothetical protein
VHNIIFVNIIKWNANHGENSKNVTFCKGLVRVFFDDTFKTAIAFFHDNTWEICIIFDSINNLANHGVIL